jgi:hypothetical protein
MTIARRRSRLSERPPLLLLQLLHLLQLAWQLGHGQPGPNKPTLAATAQELEARGVRTPAGRDRWNAKQVSRMLVT